jgi:uncharacterized membrane protein YhaH (DUF805 family)
MHWYFFWVSVFIAGGHDVYGHDTPGEATVSSNHEQILQNILSWLGHLADICPVLSLQVAKKSKDVRANTWDALQSLVIIVLIRRKIDGLVIPRVSHTLYVS